MKSNLLKSALVAIAGLTLCVSALNAQTSSSMSTTSTTATTTMAKPKKIEYHGMVKSVDTAANTITVTNKKGDMTFTVDATTKILQNHKPATLADITMGEKVGGSYTKDATGAMMACSIHGKSMAMAAPAMSTSTSTTTSSTTTPAAPAATNP